MALQHAFHAVLVADRRFISNGILVIEKPDTERNATTLDEVNHCLT